MVFTDFCLVWHIHIDSFETQSSCRMYPLHLYRGVRPPPPPNEYPGYDIKQSDGEDPVMLELWRNMLYSFNAIASRSSQTRSNGNERVLHIPPKLQGWILAIRRFVISTEMQWVHSTAPTNYHRYLPWVEWL